MLPSSHSLGVQPSNLADTTTTSVTDESTRTRFPPLADDYDIYSLNVIDLLDYLSELSFSRELKLTTARCYRRWLAAYLEEADHPDAKHVRYWVIPHSPDYYEMLLMVTDTVSLMLSLSSTLTNAKNVQKEWSTLSSSSLHSGRTKKCAL